MVTLSLLKLSIKTFQISFCHVTSHQMYTKRIRLVMGESPFSDNLHVEVCATLLGHIILN